MLGLLLGAAGSGNAYASDSPETVNPHTAHEAAGVVHDPATGRHHPTDSPHPTDHSGTGGCEPDLCFTAAGSCSAPAVPTRSTQPAALPTGPAVSLTSNPPTAGRSPPFDIFHPPRV